MAKNKEPKKVALLFSGGLDSTYLMYKNLEEGNIVYPYYIEVKNNEKKTELELNRSNLIVDVFKKNYNKSCSFFKLFS